MKPGAGIIVVKRFSDKWKVLALTSLDGPLDIPKGLIDPGETPLEAALRETKEEAGITKLDFAWGMNPIVRENMTCYVAATDQEPTIVANPHTNLVEHLGASWTDWDNLEKNTYSFLKECVRRAFETVEKTSFIR